MNITVSHGAVVINSVSSIVESPGFAVYEIDCRTKYADAFITGQGFGIDWDGPFQESVMLQVLDDTRNYEEKYYPGTEILMATTVTFPGFDRIMVSGGRYTFEVACFNYNYNDSDYYWRVRNV